MKKNVLGRMIFFASAVLFLYTALLGLNSYFRYNEFKNEYVVKSKRFHVMQLKHQTIGQLLSALDHDSSWVELSRKHLHMVFPNETMFRFYDKESQ